MIDRRGATLITPPGGGIMRLKLRSLTVGLVLILAVVPTTGCGLLRGSYKVGDTVKGAKLDLKVTGVRFAREVTGFFPKVKQPADGYLWAFVDMEVTNTQKSAMEPYNGFVAYLTTKDGKDCTPGPAIMANGPSDFRHLGSIQSLDAGATDKGSVAFYVKEGAELASVRLSSFDFNKKDVTVLVPGVVAKAAVEEVVPLGKEAVADGVGLTVHRIRKSAGYSYKSGIMTYSLTPEKGNTFLEVDMSVRNVGREPTLAVGPEVLGNEIVKTAPDSPGAGRLFAVGPDDKYNPPMGSIGMFRDEMMPKPLWWQVAPLSKGATERAWLTFNVPDGVNYQLELRMPRLGPPIRFLLE
jgi:hypothetical protein